ncbi:MFS transporter [Patescibacteria group bacterium]
MKNIKLSYLLTYLDSSWFWLGIWLLYYLKFTNYAGVGILETTAFTALTLAEIPTGALADLFGKKKTLIIGFIFSAFASFIMGTATQFNHLLVSLFILAIGGALRSGTLEALQYDSLKDEGLDKKYDKVVSNTNTVRNVAFALSAVVGGYMYAHQPGLPFIVLGVFFIVAAIICAFLVEPKTDTEKFSWKNYKEQTIKGFESLFNKKAKIPTQSLLSVSILTFVIYQFIDGSLALEFGFNERQLGALASIIYIVSAITSQSTSKILGKSEHTKKFLYIAMLSALTLAVSPIVTLYVGGIILILRQSFFTLMDNVSSVVINKNTQSNVRSTTISTYNMIRNFPYILTAFFIGNIIDVYSASSFALVMSFVIFFSSIFSLIRLNKHK